MRCLAASSPCAIAAISDSTKQTVGLRHVRDARQRLHDGKIRQRCIGGDVAREFERACGGLTRADQVVRDAGGVPFGASSTRPVSIMSVMRATPMSRGTRADPPPPTKRPAVPPAGHRTPSRRQPGYARRLRFPARRPPPPHAWPRPPRTPELNLLERGVPGARMQHPSATDRSCSSDRSRPAQKCSPARSGPPRPSRTKIDEGVCNSVISASLMALRFCGRFSAHARWRHRCHLQQSQRLQCSGEQVRLVLHSSGRCCQIGRMLPE